MHALYMLFYGGEEEAEENEYICVRCVCVYECACTIRLMPEYGMRRRWTIRMAMGMVYVSVILCAST